MLMLQSLDHTSSRMVDSSTGPWVIEQLPTILRIMPQLTTLVLAGFHAHQLRAVPESLLESLRLHTSLRHVALCNFDCRVIECYHAVLASFPRLSRLSIENVIGRVDDISLIRPSLRIKRLTLGRHGPGAGRPVYDWLENALAPDCLEDVSFAFSAHVEQADLPFISRLATNHSKSLRHLNVEFLHDTDFRRFSSVVRQLPLLRTLQIDIRVVWPSRAPTWPDYILHIVDDARVPNLSLQVTAKLTRRGALEETLRAAADVYSRLGRSSAAVRLTCTKHCLGTKTPEDLMRDAGLRCVGVDSVHSDPKTLLAAVPARAGSLFVIPGQDHVFQVHTAPLIEDWVISQDSDISHYIELFCIANSSS
ncbi:hypothetical protein PUNSTDRAFT_122135 [Punctularia strigosozonata HHB-11173 SS5]|uniref:uncharacterized protein n=1 Tax=Punctularia strigosozonata (strain HHB-11173) TaxID=741275 RepID=UPI000441644A|nr:uncharacterized protein PUNSTDRAFT_122135 [Punctularia strigosozonata HHB-11173 SS5]EIN06346.1 hypothetical protein PUNSTDRAFT_122135 [Punctularia strigosozonata HHB-11173 SS5]